MNNLGWFEKYRGIMFQKVCTLDDLWEGEMQEFDVDGERILLTHTPGGKVNAVQAVCPHQQIDLVEGELEGSVLTCTAHMWSFDVATGEGVNPKTCHLSVYPTEVRGEDVYVDVDGIEPFFAYV